MTKRLAFQLICLIALEFAMIALILWSTTIKF